MAVAATLLTLAGAAKTRATRAKCPSPEIARSDPISDSRAASGPLRRLLESRLLALEQRLQAVQEKMPDTGRPSAGGTVRAADESSSYLQDEKEIAALTERTIAQREMALKAEPLDPMWSSETEGALAQSFNFNLPSIRDVQTHPWDVHRCYLLLEL